MNIFYKMAIKMLPSVLKSTVLTRSAKTLIINKVIKILIKAGKKNILMYSIDLLKKATSQIATFDFDKIMEVLKKIEKIINDTKSNDEESDHLEYAENIMDENLINEDVSFDEIDLHNDIKFIFLSGKNVFLKNHNSFGIKDIKKIELMEDSLENLKEIVKLTDAYIVITTSVRKYKGGKNLLDTMLRKYDLKNNFFAYTTETLGKRKDKISRIIKQSEFNIDKLVILDRREDLGENLNKFLITCKNGIDEQTKQKILDALS